MFVEMVKSEAENTREQCKQKIEKVRDFLVEHEKKAKAKTLKTAQDQLGAFYHLVEERQQFEQIMTALYHKSIHSISHFIWTHIKPLNFIHLHEKLFCPYAHAFSGTNFLSLSISKKGCA